MSDLNSDVIRSLLNELITKVNETKGDKKIQKQNDEIISALKELSSKTNDNKIDPVIFAKEIAEKISDKLVPILKETSEDQVNATKEAAEEEHHSSNTNNPGNNNTGSGNGGGNGGNGGNTIDPDATEPNRNLAKAANGAAKSLSGMSKVVNIAAKGAELGLIAIAGVSVEAKKGLDNTFKAFNQISDTGLTFNGSAEKMRQSAAESGMSLDQFTKSVTSSSNTFRTLSPDQISRFNRSVVDASNSMQGLALTTEQRQDYENDYMSMISSQGQIQQQTTQSVQDGFVNLVKTSRDLSTVFGDSASSIAKAATDFLKSRDGFTSATMLTQNQGNVQTVAMSSRELFNGLGIKEDIQNALLTASATGIMTPALQKFMSASSGNAEQVRAIMSALGPIMRSSSLVSGREAGRLMLSAVHQIANTRTNYDRASVPMRAMMSNYPNENYENNISASMTARAARNFDINGLQQRLEQTDNSANHPDRMLSNAAMANRIETQDIPMSHDAVQTQAMVRFQNTITEGLNLYHSSMTQATDYLNNNSKALSHNTDIIDNMSAAMIKFIGTLPGSHALIGGATMGGEVLGDMFHAIGGTIGTLGTLAVAGFGRHGGGVNALAKQLARLTRSIPGALSKTGTRAATGAAESGAEMAGEGVASSAASRLLPGVGRLGGGVVAGGLSAFELMNNYNNYKEGKESHDDWKHNNYDEIGSGVGGVAGAALGSLVGPLGTIAGGIAGAYIGKTLGDVGYNFFNSGSEHNPIHHDNIPVQKNKDKKVLTSEDYLKNIDKNVELIRNIVNPLDIITNNTQQTNPVTGQPNNIPVSTDIDNDFTNTKASNKTEADLDSMVRGIEDMLTILTTIANSISTNVVETQTQNTMVHDLLNRLNNNVKTIGQKPRNSLNN